ncbi:MAG: hypothetical protein GQ526_06490 [Ardenticatenales bacterium]|nr:hypothetical protein [Ardenticatenales bacterium]
MRSDTAALWLSVLKLPPENLDRALKSFPEHRYRSNAQCNPAAARKACQMRLNGGNWMKPRISSGRTGYHRPGLLGANEGNINRQHGDRWTPARIPAVAA